MVLDTNVLVAALRSDCGASRRILEKALEGAISILISVPLMIEYEAVLTGPNQLAVTGLSVQQTAALLDSVAAIAEPIPLRFLWRPRLKDPTDEMVLETAVNGRVDWLVTFNLTHLKAAAADFGIPVVTPRELWKEVFSNEKK